MALDPRESPDPTVGRRLDILVLGSAQFSDRSWVNCQQVAARLAQRHRVLFVDSIGLRNPSARRSDLWRIWARLRDAGRGMKRVSPNLAVLSPILEARSTFLLIRAIRRALKRTHLQPDAVIVYLPTWAPVVEMLRSGRRARVDRLDARNELEGQREIDPAEARTDLEGLEIDPAEAPTDSEALGIDCPEPRTGHEVTPRVLYHCVDAYAANPGVDAEQLDRLECRLLDHVDVVLAVSTPLYQRLERLHSDVRLFPNAADVELFAAMADRPAPDAMIALPRPRMLYLGNLAAYKVDLELLERLAAARPDWSWVLVGPQGRGDPETNLAALLRMPQVHWLGEHDPPLAAACVGSADVCLLPLRRSPSTEASAPLKIFEYLASGRPIVATPIPAVAKLAEAGLIRTAQDPESWIVQIEESLCEGGRGREERQREALRHGWTRQIHAIENLLWEWPANSERRTEPR